MEWIVVTHIRDDLCLVSHQDQTLSAHTTEHEALSAAFAFASRCIQNGDKTVVVLTKEQGPGRALRRHAVAGCLLDGNWWHHSHR